MQDCNTKTFVNVSSFFFFFFLFFIYPHDDVNFISLVPQDRLFSGHEQLVKNHHESTCCGNKVPTSTINFILFHIHISSYKLVIGMYSQLPQCPQLKLLRVVKLVRSRD